ncbi:MAG: response regulator transcription factor [bacterium]
MENAQKTRILLVDDHPLIRDGMARAIEKDESLMVCGEAGSVPEALEAVQRTQPDLVCVDISLEESSGIDLVRDLSHRETPIPCLVISMYEDLAYVESAFRAGARGYLLKRESAPKLAGAIRQILRGEVFTSQRVVAGMVGEMSREPDTPEPAPQDILTHREYEIFQLLGRGVSRAEIADQLCVSAKTVDTHTERIKEKLHFETTFQLLHSAVKHCLKYG